MLFRLHKAMYSRVFMVVFEKIHSDRLVCFQPNMKVLNIFNALNMPECLLGNALHLLLLHVFKRTQTLQLVSPVPFVLAG